MRTKKKDLLKRIEELEKRDQNIEIKDIRKREDLIFNHLIEAYTHEVKYCRGFTKELYTRLLYELMRSEEFRKISTSNMLSKIRNSINKW